MPCVPFALILWSYDATISNAVNLGEGLSLDGALGVMYLWSPSLKISLSCLRFRCLYGSSHCQETGRICLFANIQGCTDLVFPPCQFKFEVLRQGRRLDSGWKNGCTCTDKRIIQTLLPQETWQIMPSRSFLFLSTIYTMAFKDALQLSEITLIALYYDNKNFPLNHSPMELNQC